MKRAGVYIEARGANESLIRRIQIAFLVALSALCMSCSVQPVPNTPAEDGTAWWAYQQCLASLSRYQDKEVCNRVGTSMGSSYTDYTMGQYLYVDDYQPTGSIFTNQSYKAVRSVAYKTYLENLDPATQEDLKSQWLALAAQAE